MIVLGIILLIAGFLLKISVLWTIGIILLVVGVVLALLGSTGRAVGGRPQYFYPSTPTCGRARVVLRAPPPAAAGPSASVTATRLCLLR